MCVVSMVSDHYQDKWTTLPGILQPSVIQTWPNATGIVTPVTQEQFAELLKEVKEMKALLIRAIKYDEMNNEPECAMEEKVALLKRVAGLVGVSLDDVFPVTDK